MRPRRPLLAAGLIAAMAGWPGAGARASGSPPEVFDLAADAAPILIEGSVPAAAPGVHVVGVARSSVTINSQPYAQSQAAIGYSPAVESLPLFGVSVLPPEVQPWCYSYFPGEPADASCGGPVLDGDIFRAAVGSGHTSSKGDSADPRTLRSEASTAVAEAAVAGVVSIAKAVSTSAAGGDGNRMAGRAATGLDDLTVAGVLNVRGIRSRVAGALGGRPGSGAVEHDLVISGAEVGGVSVTVDEQGVHAGGQSSGPVLSWLQDQVNQVLSNAGVAVRTVPAVPPAVAPDGTGLRVSSGGLLVTVSRSEGAFSLLVGQSNLQMTASRRAPAASGAAEINVPVPPIEAAAKVLPALATTDPPWELGPGPTPTFPLGEISTAATSDQQAGAGTTGQRPASRQLATPRAPARWTIPFAPFAVLVLALPLLAQARRLVLVPGVPR